MMSFKLSYCTLIFLLFLSSCEVLGKLRFRRGIPGGISEVSTNDPYILTISRFVIEKLNEDITQDTKKKELVEIIQAGRQVVAGTLVHLTLNVKDGTQKQEECRAKVWDRPWLNKTELTDITCTTKEGKQKRSYEEESMLYRSAFNDFMQKHNKVYDSDEEYEYRFRVFAANMHKIRKLQKTEQGTAKYGPTFFADLTRKEFKQYLGLNPNLKQGELPLADIPRINLPTSFDWRSYNAVTPVKNQGMCGSCWAFSVTGNVEGQWAIKRGQLIPLSEQELVDCDKDDNGCGGGYMTNAYQSIIKLGGLETENDYPYDAEREQCHFNETEVKVTISGAVNLTKDEVKMAQWLYKNGPISIGVNANGMQFYMRGVSHPWKILCNPEELDHGVLIVGFGVDQSRIRKKLLPYWIIKNSWGARWGEKGYYRLYRGDNSCGVSEMATSAIVS